MIPNTSSAPPPCHRCVAGESAFPETAWRILPESPTGHLGRSPAAPRPSPVWYLPLVVGHRFQSRIRTFPAADIRRALIIRGTPAYDLPSANGRAFQRVGFIRKDSQAVPFPPLIHPQPRPSDLTCPALGRHHSLQLL